MSVRNDYVCTSIVVQKVVWTDGSMRGERIALRM
jgi:hypothetical protein